MKQKLTTLALAGTLVLATASTASALTLQQNLRNDDTQPRTQPQTNAPATVRTDQGETAPFIFGSTTTVERATSRPAEVTARQSERRTLNVQIRNVQRQYLNLKRAGNLSAAEPYRVQLERLKAQQRTLNVTASRNR
ncbi:MAG: hypothetical protein QOJ98_2604 [Acidobacteriota bacterium]|jgi:hypothetical protein|nr:hypothetical protein [Acidobacteriota bacterium]